MDIMANQKVARQLSQPPRALTIAGSDSGGGAGIQADLKTFTTHGVYGTSVITVVTSQNTLGIDGVHVLPPEFISQQLNAVLSDIGTDAIKIGAVTNSQTIRAIVDTLNKHYPEMNANNSNLVLDPVMISTSGNALLDKEAINTLIKNFFPLAFILTPNVPEAEALLGIKINSLEEMKRAATKLAKLGPCIVLLKGGHLPFNKSDQIIKQSLDNDDDTELELVDVIYDSRNDSTTEIRRAYLKSTSTHGTGCTLSAAIAANLTNGIEAIEAIEKSIDYVQAAIRHAHPIGGKSGMGVGDKTQSYGPVNHIFGTLRLAIEPPSKYNRHPFTKMLLQKYASEWKAYTEHAFVQGIGDGTLPHANFIHYIKQDYLFLQNYARANGLASFKCRTLVESEMFSKIVIHIAHETKMHIDFCAEWGVTYPELLATSESLANVAYTRYVLDIGATGDVLDLILALAPCLIGYGHIGRRLFNDPKTVRDGNVYWNWISNYAGDAYQKAVQDGIDKLEIMFRSQCVTETRLCQLEKTFVDVTRLEIAFWDMGLHCT